MQSRETLAVHRKPSGLCTLPYIGNDRLRGLKYIGELNKKQETTTGTAREEKMDKKER